MADLFTLKLPDFGEGVAEAEIVTWHVSVGDIVDDGQANFNPNFSDYDVVISNFGWNAAAWPETTKRSFAGYKAAEAMVAAVRPATLSLSCCERASKPHCSHPPAFLHADNNLNV